MSPCGTKRWTHLPLMVVSGYASCRKPHPLSPPRPGRSRPTTPTPLSCPLRHISPETPPAAAAWRGVSRRPEKRRKTRD